MKFVAKIKAPDIPLEILEAQEEGRLILFCGAGISCQIGLHTFAGLVEKVYEQLGEVPYPLEKKAKDEKLFDRVLYLLERRLKNSSVRKAIIDILKIPDKTDISSFDAILQLAKSKTNEYRLVTTNFDHGFLRSELHKPKIFTAPTLPVPKIHTWNGLVHLHGLIDEKEDNEGNHLVITSSDFGRAYLIDRWAAQFVTELFKHFSVLFIGYSVNDPILRYTVDAIAAEISLGSEDFHPFYCLSDAAVNDLEEKKSQWESKGIKPIFYKDHADLHETLKCWADYTRDGLNAKAHFIRTTCINPPSSPYSKNGTEQNVIDVIKEKKDPLSQEVTGYPSCVFKEMPAAIEWLPVLQSEGLFSLVKLKNCYISPVSNKGHSSLCIPNKISYELWQWVTQYLDHEIVINWVIDRGCHLHPDFRKLVNIRIREGKIHEPYLAFWRIITSGFLKDSSTDSKIYDVTNSLKAKIDALSLNSFKQIIEPVFELTKGRFHTIEVENPELKVPFHADVVIQMDQYHYEQFKQIKGYPENFTKLLLFVTESLNKALELWEFIGEASDKHDPSYWHMYSIAEHGQNSLHNSWIILIELCRDLWDKALKSDASFACSILNLWRNFKYPTFRRLVLYGYTNSDIFDAEVAFDYLIENEGRWIWAHITKREAYKLLEKLYLQLPPSSIKKLINIINLGPPRELYVETLTHEEWLKIQKKEICLFLNKIKSIGFILDEASVEKINFFIKEFPDSTLEDYKEGFVSWMDISTELPVDKTLNEIKSLEPQKLIDFLTEDVPPFYYDGRINTFRKIVISDRSYVIDMVDFLIKNSNWNSIIWCPLLVGIAESEAPSVTLWETISLALLNTDNELFLKEPWAVAWWLKKMTDKISDDIPKNFWSLLIKLININIHDPILDKKGIFNQAINHPFGILVESALTQLGKYKFKAGNKITSEEALNFLNLIATGNSNSFILARVILASSLYYFYIVDQKWTESYLIPRFDWNTSDIEAATMWSGYLRTPQITIDLANQLSKSLISALSKLDHFTFTTNLYRLFTYICLEYPNLYTHDDIIAGLKSIAEKGSLGDVAQYLWIYIGKDNNYEIWQNRIKPFLKNYWPKSANYKTEFSSENLAILCIQVMAQQFKDALSLVKPLTKPTPGCELHIFISQLEQSDLLNTMAYDSFDLLAHIYEVNQFPPSEALTNTFYKLLENDPEIKNHPHFNKINDHIIQHQRGRP